MISRIAAVVMLVPALVAANAERGAFLAAVGGCYRNGFEASLVRLGIPYERLLDAEFDRAEVLRKYDLVCLSAPEGSWPDIATALSKYVRGGGTLVIESTRGGNLASLIKVPRETQVATIPGPAGE